MSSVPPSTALMILGLIVISTAGCVGEEGSPVESSDDEPDEQGAEKACHLSTGPPMIHLYGCGQEVLSARLAPGDVVTEEFVIENLTGFSIAVEAGPLSTGTFHISVGSFEGVLEVRAGKWLADTTDVRSPGAEDRFRALIDECDASSVAVSFDSDVALPATVNVHLDSHADHRRFVYNAAGDFIQPTCNSTWNHSEWPI